MATRYFEKRNGSQVATWQIEPRGVRYYVAWSSGGAPQGMTVTRDSEADASAMIARKIREKLKDGFVEVRPAVTEPSPAANAAVLRPVLEPFAAHAKQFKREVHRVSGLERSYEVFGGLGFTEYLLLGPTETCGLWFAVKEKTCDAEHAPRLLAFLEAHHTEVFAVTIAWKARLPEAIGPFDHALILSPEVAQIHQPGLTRKQLFQAFPIYDCEFRGDEDVTQADARTNGRGSIPCARWDRVAHPVLDLRLQSAAQKKQSKLLIYDPAKTNLSGMLKQLQALPESSFLELKNYQGAICRVVRRDCLELDLGDQPSRAISADQIVTELEAFIGASTRRAAISQISG